jgi:hypothetical protein
MPAIGQPGVAIRGGAVHAGRWPPEPLHHALSPPSSASPTAASRIASAVQSFVRVIALQGRDLGLRSFVPHVFVNRAGYREFEQHLAPSPFSLFLHSSLICYFLLSSRQRQTLLDSATFDLGHSGIILQDNVGATAWGAAHNRRLLLILDGWFSPIFSTQSSTLALTLPFFGIFRRVPQRYELLVMRACEQHEEGLKNGTLPTLVYCI